MNLWRWIRGGHWERWSGDRGEQVWVRVSECSLLTGRRYGFGTPLCEDHR